MNWFTQQRQDWIALMLRVYGHINRQHLMRMFGISQAQATLDFNRFNEADPSAMTYDPIRKTYVATKAPN
jgi:DeoR/GlpR family transcriptional regulator of sugar metabolism